MSNKDRYIVFNNTGRNISLEIFLPIGMDPISLPYYKRRKYLNSKKIAVMVPRSNSIDLVELTGMSCKDLDDNKDLQERLRRLGPEFKIVEKTFVYSFDEEKYLELEELADPNFRYVEPTIDDDFEAFLESIPEPKKEDEEPLEDKIKRLRAEAEESLKPPKKKPAKKKTTKKKTTKKSTTKKSTTTTKKPTTKKKTTKKTTTKKTTKKTTSRNLTKNSKKVKEE
jgi:outer membrane biosynthesis protein TonB